MIRRMSEKDREILSIMLELTKAVRCCRQDEMFCDEMSFTQFIIIDAIAASRMLDMTGLTKILSVDKSTATRLVEPLIIHNLVVKERSLQDSRVTILKLTKEGMNMHTKIQRRITSFIRAIQAEIPVSKRKASIEGIEIFLNALQKVFQKHPVVITADTCIKLV